jgi:spore coat polysaccharide biosynthesis predicted glycosyltransferase SpsG
VPLAVLQDDARHAVCADLFVNGNLYGSEIEYDFIGDEPKLCLGTDYVLLRQEIRERAIDDPPWRETPKRAIIIMGGSDIAGLTPTVVQAFDEFDLQVDTVVGPGCSKPHEREIRQTASDCSADVRVLRDPEDLIGRMFQADFAVSTASSTTYELLALGTPIISIPVADNQALIAQALRERDIARVIEPNNLQRTLPEAISRYMNGSKLRQDRRILGRKLVDGEGAERIAELIIEIAHE